MPKYLTKQVEIEAVQWDGTVEAATGIINWILDGGHTARFHDRYGQHITPHRPDDVNETVDEAHISIDTLEGTMRCDPDDFVIRGTRGEFYPCKPDSFADKYEQVG